MTRASVASSPLLISLCATSRVLVATKGERKRLENRTPLKHDSVTTLIPNGFEKFL